MAEQQPFEPLTPREREILALLCQRLSDREIAQRLFLGINTVKWYNRQIFPKLGVKSRKDAIQRAVALGLADKSVIDQPAPKHNLPAALTPFVNRSVELAEVRALLSHPHTRLLTILAPGGMGKTRLALEAAEAMLDQFDDGICYAPLTGVSAADHVVSAIAESLGVQFMPDGRTPPQQLCDFVRRKQLLLLLDNFEHVLDSAPLVLDMLAAAPRLKVLATTRERLGVAGESVYVLAGIDYPDDNADDAIRYGAVQLLIECAQRANPHFQVGDVQPLARICQTTQGMPLAIELAAAWSGALSATDIAAEIARSADFLRTSARGTPERLRSVRAVFEAAWARLDDEARRVFRQMSVFRGGCTREAAHAVTGASLATLAALTDKALLWYVPRTQRYEIHELLRQYAEEELRKAGETEAAQDAHRVYYGELTYTYAPGFSGAGLLETLAIFDADWDNIRQAFAAARRRATPEAIEPFTLLSAYYQMRGLYGESDSARKAAIAALEPNDSRTLAAIHGVFAINSALAGRLQESQEMAQRGVEMLHRLGADEEQPMTLVAYADSLTFTNRPTEAEAIYRRVIEIARETGQPFWAGAPLLQLGLQARRAGNHYEAKALLSEANDIVTKLDSLWSMGFTLNALAYQSYIMGDLGEAQRIFGDVLAVGRRGNFQLHIQLGMNGLGLVMREQGEWRGVRTIADENLRLQYKAGTPDSLILITMTTLTEAALALGDIDDARRLLAATLALLENPPDEWNFRYWRSVAAQYLAAVGETGHAVTVLSIPASEAMNQLSYTYITIEIKLSDDALISTCREALSPEEYAAAVERGKTLTPEAAIAELSALL